MVIIINGLNVSDIVAFSMNLRTKCVFLVMFRPPLPPCTHLYALVLTPPPPLDAYIINGRPLYVYVINSFDLKWESVPDRRAPVIETFFDNVIAMDWKHNF